MWFALCLGFMLRLPTIRKDVESPTGWEWESVNVQGYPVRWLKERMESEQTACHFDSRMEFSRIEYVGKKCVVSRSQDTIASCSKCGHMVETNVYLIGLPCTYVMILRMYLNHFEQRGWLKNGFIVHGHSLGGFVAQRVLRPELETSNHAQGVILESPVTSYEYINNQTCDYLRIPKILQRPMMRRLLRYYNRLNPSQYQVPSIEFLRPPEWGLPQCPTVLIQGEA